MSTATAYALVRGIPADALVLAKRPLVAGFQLADTARFGDDKWDLTPAVHQQHQQALSLNFLTIPAQFRRTAKEFFFVLLRHDHPDGQTELGIVTIRGRFSQLKEFFHWADQRGVTALSALTLDDLTQYRAFIDAGRNSLLNKSNKRGTVRQLWVYRTKLTGDTLSVDPYIVWDDPTTYGNRGRNRRGARENATDRIPEEVVGPLLTWSLRWLEDFADDILAGLSDWQQARSTKLSRSTVDGETPRDRLLAVLDRYRREGRPLPRVSFGSKAVKVPMAVNLTQLAREAGVHVSTFNKQSEHRQLIDAAADELGLDDTTYLRTPIRGTLDGQPWLPALRWDMAEDYARLLQGACYVVIAYLSGMRDSEVKHMKRGCMTIWRDEEDRPVRYRVTSQAFKGEGTPEGVEATWIVNASVAKAIKVLETLQPADQPYLFAVPPSSRAHPKTRTNSAQTSETTRRNLAYLIEWTNDYCTRLGRPDGIPEVNGRPWKLQTRQFRRTLAWCIARQPGGTIAGAIQYRHHSIQMFEGYAGTSASGFRPEVEAEQAIARGQKLGDIILSPAPQKLTGPAADEAEARLAALEDEIDFSGKVITDPKRLARHMRRHDPHIYPGKFVTCVYNPDRALCRRSDSDGPSLPDCQPLKCRNVALTAENADAFLAWLQRLERALANGVILAPYVRDRMEQRRTELTEFLEANNVPTSNTKETVR
ncbi:hypothetical protein P1P75_05885 [Streptomyces sp. ID05-39B]|uniref:hypothetical protein n=1 Tax=Streptomyces sp. ID05-39B TaxID=3028664 RepID=UPI0029A9208F|nr:hypothetical protein [Streptomyces sp. ID05-39B]MDX3525976.1 hypothetical protein [Streptomyces sp. ID05-39B]